MQSDDLHRIKSLIFGAILGLFWTSSAQADGLSVFSAASLRDATLALSEVYVEDGGARPVSVFAASSAVARQIAQGAPADVALLADVEWADWLRDNADVLAVAPIAGNRLVLLTRSDAKLNDIRDLERALEGGVLAMAQVDAVPAGRYGKAALEHASVWDGVSAQVIQAANVRAALRFVELGEAPFGIGYASDLKALPELNEAFSFAPDSHAPIVYVAVQITPQGADFMTFLKSDAAQSVLSDWGFTPLPDMHD